MNLPYENLQCLAVRAVAPARDRAGRVLPRFRGQLGEDTELLIPSLEPTLHPGAVEALDAFEMPDWPPSRGGGRVARMIPLSPGAVRPYRVVHASTHESP